MVWCLWANRKEISLLHLTSWWWWEVNWFLCLQNWNWVKTMFVLFLLVLSWGLFSLRVCLSVLLGSGVLFWSVFFQHSIFITLWCTWLRWLRELDLNSLWILLNFSEASRILVNAPLMQVGGHSTEPNNTWPETSSSCCLKCAKCGYGVLNTG